MNEWSSTTNEELESCTPAKCGCVVFWEMQQQKALKRLSNRVFAPRKYAIISDVEARARRIAAVYARIYLETEFKSSLDLRGRYYWMGFGAFASKTVAYILKDWTDLLSPARGAFRKGNFWLFMEIAPWFFAWNESPKSFKDCLRARDVSQFKNLKNTMNNLTWSEEALSTLNNLKSTPQIEKAFNEVSKIEAKFKTVAIEQTRFENTKFELMKHLEYITEQEQRNVLQPLVWETGLGQTGAVIGKVGSIFSIGPNATLVLSSDYDRFDVQKETRLIGPHHQPTTEVLQYRGRHRNVLNQLKEEVYEDASPLTFAPSYSSRMKWIKRAAAKYHRLMLDDKGRAFIHKELAIISTWISDNAGK